METGLILSVAMLVCNREKYLSESINSILKQTYQNFEFLIVDDASCDNSFALLQSYQKKDKRIKLFQNKNNKGEAYNRNFLIQKAKGKYLAWMDDDDLCPNYRLQEQVNFLEKNPNIDIVGGQTIMFEGRKKIAYAPLTDHSIKSHLLSICSFTNASTMLRLEKIKKYNFQYPVEFLVSPDFAFLVNAVTKLNFANLPRIFYYYRWHDNQLSITASDKKQATYIITIKKHLARFGIFPENKTIATFFPLLEPLKSFQELQALEKLVNQVLAIKNFYGYQGINKEMKYKLLLVIYYQYYRFYKTQGIGKIALFFFRYGIQALCCFFFVKWKKNTILLRTYWNQWVC